MVNAVMLAVLVLAGGWVVLFSLAEVLVLAGGVERRCLPGKRFGRRRR